MLLITLQDAHLQNRAFDRMPGVFFKGSSSTRIEFDVDARSNRVDSADVPNNLPLNQVSHITMKIYGTTFEERITGGLTYSKDWSIGEVRHHIGWAYSYIGDPHYAPANG